MDLTSAGADTPVERPEVFQERVLDGPIIGVKMISNMPAMGEPGGSHDPAPKVGAVLCAGMTDIPRLYDNTRPNADLAIAGRVDGKQRPATPEPWQKASIQAIKDHMLGKDGPFSPERIEKWARQNPELLDLKSKKWSEMRMHRAYYDAMGRESEKLCIPGLAVKKEQMPKQKPPRPIVADGDPGQVAALQVVCCIEALYSDFYTGRVIKHLDRHTAMRKVTSTMGRGGRSGDWSILEGDGSAWDTTMNDELRTLENAIAERVGNELCFHTWMASEKFNQARRHLAEAGRIKLKMPKDSNPFSKIYSKAWKLIKNMRRSGDRGTSIFNNLVNQAIWITCLAGKDKESIKDLTLGKNEIKKDNFGSARTVAMCFEGDDSIVRLSPAIDDETKEQMQTWFTQLGLNMKLLKFDRDSERRYVEFVGCHLRLGPGGTTDAWIPDLPRALKTLGMLKSPEALDAYARGDVTRISQLYGQKLAGLALGFNNSLPLFADALFLKARELGGVTVVDREVQMKYGEFKDITERYDGTRQPRRTEWQLGLLNELYGTSEGYKEFLENPVIEEEAWAHDMFVARVPATLRS